jgi:acetyltransferase-like isoleucine patch superfamily enzyme
MSWHRFLDPTRLAHNVECGRAVAASLLATPLARVTSRRWGVELGKGCKFHGAPVWRRYPGTTIAIAGRCEFRSSHKSNLIGICHPCVISTLGAGATITIGEECGFSGAVVAAELAIEIGKNVRVGANSVITDTDWHAGDPRTTGPQKAVIGNNVWLGLNVTVLKGVTIGAGTIVGAGSVVTKPLPANVVAAGVPARVLHRLSDV